MLYSIRKVSIACILLGLIAPVYSNPFIDRNDDVERFLQSTTLSGKYGLTWGNGAYVPENPDLFRVGCSGTPTIPLTYPYTSSSGSCNAYAGDTPCEAYLPILCLLPSGFNRPCYDIDCTSHAMPKEFYCGWSESYMILSPPVLGLSLTSRTVADNICESHFGPGFRMGEHGDGLYVVGMDRTNYCYNSWASSIPSSGGWGFSGYGTRGPFWTRFWVAINDQPANCWN